MGCALRWLETSAFAGQGVDGHAPPEREQTCRRAGARASLLPLSFRPQPPCLPLTSAGIPSLGTSVSKSVKQDNAICLEGPLDRSDEMTRMKRMVPSVCKSSKNHSHRSRAVRPSRRVCVPEAAARGSRPAPGSFPWQRHKMPRGLEGGGVWESRGRDVKPAGTFTVPSVRQ